MSKFETGCKRVFPKGEKLDLSSMQRTVRDFVNALKDADIGVVLLTEDLELTPCIQVIKNTVFKPDEDLIALFGLRLHVSF